MFNWLKNLFKSTEIYPPKDRRIFKYFDGQSIREVDPMIIYERYAEVSESLRQNFVIMNSPSRNANQKYLEAIEQIKKIFDVKEFVDKGLLRNELFDELDRFLEFCEGVKKNSNPSATSQTAIWPTLGSGSAESLTTLSSSPSGSIAAESTTEEPTSSLTGQPSHSAA